MHSLVSEHGYTRFFEKPRAALKVELVSKRPLRVLSLGMVLTKPDTSWCECKPVIVDYGHGDIVEFDDLWVCTHSIDPYHLLMPKEG